MPASFSADALGLGLELSWWSLRPHHDGTISKDVLEENQNNTQEIRGRDY